MPTKVIEDDKKGSKVRQFRLVSRYIKDKAAKRGQLIRALLGSPASGYKTLR
jgi:hypothetical protein